MKAVFQRWQILLLTVFFAFLPVSVAQANPGANLDDAYFGELVAVPTALGDRNRTLESVDQARSTRTPIQIAGPRNTLRSKKARSILQRMDAKADIAGAKKPKIKPAPTAPIRNASASAKPVPAKKASFAKPVTPSVADLIEFDRFSLKDFAVTGFAPQCMFSDQATSGSYLENRIAGTLAMAENSIYKTTDFKWVVEPEEKDAYWQYYSDCDTWNVVFAKSRILALKTVKPPAKSTSTASTREVMKTITSKVWQTVSRTGAELYHFARLAEFHATEIPEERLSLPVQATLIEGLKSVRPIITNVIGNELVRNPYMWIKCRQFSFEMRIAGTTLGKVWNDLTANQGYIGPIESNALFPQLQSQKKSRR